MSNKDYRRLHNMELPNATEDWAPVITEVYVCPMTRSDGELAILREPHLDRCDDEWWSGRVEFMGVPGKYYSRRVWRKSTLPVRDMGVVNGLPPGERGLED